MPKLNNNNIPPDNNDSDEHDAKIVANTIVDMMMDEERPLADPSVEPPTDLARRPLRVSHLVGSKADGPDEKPGESKQEQRSSSPTRVEPERIGSPGERMFQYYVAVSKVEEEENAEAVEKRKEEHERKFPPYESHYDPRYPCDPEEEHAKE